MYVQILPTTVDPIVITSNRIAAIFFLIMHSPADISSNPAINNSVSNNSNTTNSQAAIISIAITSSAPFISITNNRSALAFNIVLVNNSVTNSNSGGADSIVSITICNNNNTAGAFNSMNIIANNHTMSSAPAFIIVTRNNNLITNNANNNYLSNNNSRACDFIISISISASAFIFTINKDSARVIINKEFTFCINNNRGRDSLAMVLLICEITNLMADEPLLKLFLLILLMRRPMLVFLIRVLILLKLTTR